MNLFDRNDILPSPRKIGRLDENVVVIPNAKSIPILNKTYSIAIIGLKYTRTI